MSLTNSEGAGNERPGAILKKFSLAEIAHYFDDYYDELRRRLTS